MVAQDLALQWLVDLHVCRVWYAAVTEGVVRHEVVRVLVLVVRAAQVDRLDRHRRGVQRLRQDRRVGVPLDDGTLRLDVRDHDVRSLPLADGHRLRYRHADRRDHVEQLGRRRILRAVVEVYLVGRRRRRRYGQFQQVAVARHGARQVGRHALRGGRHRQRAAPVLVAELARPRRVYRQNRAQTRTYRVLQRRLQHQFGVHLHVHDRRRVAVVLRAQRHLVVVVARHVAQREWVGRLALPAGAPPVVLHVRATGRNRDVQLDVRVRVARNDRVYLLRGHDVRHGDQAIQFRAGHTATVRHQEGVASAILRLDLVYRQFRTGDVQ